MLGGGRGAKAGTCPLQDFLEEGLGGGWRQVGRVAGHPGGLPGGARRAQRMTVPAGCLQQATCPQPHPRGNPGRPGPQRGLRPIARHRQVSRKALWLGSHGWGLGRGPASPKDPQGTAPTLPDGPPAPRTPGSDLSGAAASRSRQGHAAGAWGHPPGRWLGGLRDPRGAGLPDSPGGCTDHPHLPRVSAGPRPLPEEGTVARPRGHSAPARRSRRSRRPCARQPAEPVLAGEAPGRGARSRRPQRDRTHRRAHWDARHWQRAGAAPSAPL